MYEDLDPELENNLSRSHDVIGRLVASVNGSPFTYPVDLVEGSVSVSGSAGIRRKLSAVINAHIDDAECDVFRTEVRAEYGIRLMDNSVIWTPVGTFVVTDANETGYHQVAIEGEDRWRRIVNARFERPISTSGSHVSAIQSLVLGADGRITFENDLVSTATHPQAIWERDRDKAIMELSKSLGAVVYFDAMGVAHLARPKAIGSTPDWSIGGGDGGVLSDSKRKRSQGNTYNAMVVEGEDSSGNVPVRAVAYISNPESKLLYGGSYARRARFYRSSMITTQVQADATALFLLTKVSGTSQTVEVFSAPHPGLDAGDIIAVEVEPQQWENHVVDSFTLPLGPGGITIATRTAIDPDEEGELQ